MICDQTWTATDTLRTRHINTSALEIMERVALMREAETLGLSYAEILASFMTIMQTKSVK